MFKNYYEILEVSRNASIEVIEKAYITLAKKYHPDANNYDSDYANDKMKEINEAYDVLKNTEKRNEYNRAYDEMLYRNLNDQNKETESRTNIKEESVLKNVTKRSEKQQKNKYIKFKIIIIVILILPIYLGANRIIYSEKYDRIAELQTIINISNEKKSNITIDDVYTNYLNKKELNDLKTEVEPFKFLKK